MQMRLEIRRKKKKKKEIIEGKEERKDTGRESISSSWVPSESGGVSALDVGLKVLEELDETLSPVTLILIPEGENKK